MIDSLLEKEEFSFIDYYFAKQFSVSESATLLLCYLLATARQGHLCIHIDKEKINPSPFSFFTDQEIAAVIEKKLIEAFFDLPSSLYEKIQDPEKIPTSPICIFKNKLYLQKNFLLERQFLVEIQRLQKEPFSFQLNKIEHNSCLDKQQFLALQRALTSSLSVISGGPGTGKTFTAIEIVRSFLEALPEEEKGRVLIKLAAPTGKAAALLEKKIREKLGDLTCVVCGTLHSFLKIGSNEEPFSKSVFADLFLIDEASMLDAKLFVRLLSSLPGGGRVVFMGDKDQLPPVESGGFFADLIDLADLFQMPVTLLQKNIRLETPSLQNFASAVLNQNIEKIKQSREVKIFSSLRKSNVKELIEKECKTSFAFSHSADFDPLIPLKEMEKFRILSSIRKGLFGVESINQIVLEKFLEKRQSHEKIVCPILITENDAPRGLMNGDTGILVSSVSSIKKGLFNSGDKAYFLSKEGAVQAQEFSASVLPLFTFAYCLSVHKSQGSEYDRVLVILPKGSEKFGKEVLYTAITRAKKEVLVMTEEPILEAILQKTSRKISGFTFKSAEKDA